MPKPPLRIQVTTLWDYPSQNYGGAAQGDQNYPGATPSYIIWNLLMRYTGKKDLVIDPMCGSGTTLDVCRDLGRRCLGYDIHPIRDDIFMADARKLPLDDAKSDFVFLDPPYGDNIRYSDELSCIGRLPASSPEYYREMDLVIREMRRILKPGRHLSLYVCDHYSAKRGFVPVGFQLFQILCGYLEPVDIVAVVRRNKDLAKGNYRKAAEQENFFLRGFNYLFIMRKKGN